MANKMNGQGSNFGGESRIGLLRLSHAVGVEAVSDSERITLCGLEITVDHFFDELVEACTGGSA